MDDSLSSAERSISPMPLSERERRLLMRFSDAITSYASFLIESKRIEPAQAYKQAIVVVTRDVLGDLPSGDGATSAHMPALSDSGPAPHTHATS